MIAAPLPDLQTAALAVGARPTAAGDGVDISSWKASGQFSHVNLTVFLQSDGAGACTLDSPVGGAAGVEVWIQKKDKAGVLRWWLVGNLNGGTVIPVVNNGGAAFPLELAAIGARLAIAGAPSAHAPTYFFEPIEFMMEG